MNLLVVCLVVVLLITLLTLLAQWQQKIDEMQRSRVLEEIRLADETGSDKPIGQHPQVDVRSCIGCGACVAACPESGVLGMVDGVARVIHGARCIGHGRCADVCPVSAIEVGLGDTSGRADIPRLSEQLETSVPGVFIAGELGGFALVRNAVAQGTQAIESIARDLGSRSRSRAADVADVLIVGAGPAGIAATLKAVECGLTYYTIDQDDIGGTVRKYPRRKLTLTGSLELPLYGPVKQTEFIKEDLIRFWEQLIAGFRLEIHTGVRLLGVASDAESFVIETSKGVIRARRVLLAMGRRGTPRKLDVPGEDQEHVLYQLIDAASYVAQHVLVVGGGDSAVEAAIALANQANNVVTLSYRRDHFFRLKSRNDERIRQYVAGGRIRVIFGSSVSRVESRRVVICQQRDGVAREETLTSDFVFVLAGGEPPYPLLKTIGVRFGESEQAGAASTTAEAWSPVSL